jgi:hypothetical protein
VAKPTPSTDSLLIVRVHIEAVAAARRKIHVSTEPIRTMSPQ